ncbi:MAG: DUF1684 domain-containing protein [Vicinamibacterales bacterium]
MALGCSSEPTSAGGYVNIIHSERAAKDAALRDASEPIPEALKPTLLPLKYYAVDERCDIPAAMTPFSGALPQSMVYSDGAVRKVRRVGTLRFRLNGRALELNAFVEVGASEQDLFVPFGDLTNGTETYPAGRMLDVRRTVTDLYDLDFNKAYNPSCYYNPAYSCPIPPRENRLAVAVTAGEHVNPRHP